MTAEELINQIDQIRANIKSCEMSLTHVSVDMFARNGCNTYVRDVIQAEIDRLKAQETELKNIEVGVV